MSATDKTRSLPRRSIFAALFLSSGAALIVYIVSGISLLAAFGLVVALATLVGAFAWRRITNNDRVAVQRLVSAGLVAGLLATTAYDLSRFALIKLTGIAFWPFDIFTIFGRALFGVDAQGPFVTVAGIAYHFTNGICFAIAYTIWAKHPGVLTGIVWALMLEVLMVSIYPGWLGLKALDEFLQVSIVGHLVYGSVLGFVAQYLLAGKETGT